MPLDDSDPRNPYEQVAAKLRQAIAGGLYKPGGRLPTQKELAVLYGVAVGTVASALDVLRDEGLIQSWQGKGTFVRDKEGEAAKPSGDAAEITNALERLAARVEALEARFESVEETRASQQGPQDDPSGAPGRQGDPTSGRSQP